MANPEHLATLKFGSSEWNKWRAENPRIVPNLAGCHFREGRFSRANFADGDFSLCYFGRSDLTGSNLSQANLSEASLRGANLAGANLTGAALTGTDLTGADLSGAVMVSTNLSGSYLARANLTGANLEHANLTECDLQFATAVDTNLSNADLTCCLVYGIAAWNTNLTGARQRDLIITPPHQHTVTTDSLHVAQFVYLLLNNGSLRDVIETVGKKAILILGRFTEQRKMILNTIRDHLRVAGLIPIMFDFEGPRNRDITETVSTLAHLARAVIVDITDPRCVPQELMTIVPSLPSVRIFPIIESPNVSYSMFEHLQRYPWVDPLFHYAGEQDLTRWVTEIFKRGSGEAKSSRN